jgi:hypothetical protein
MKNSDVMISADITRISTDYAKLKGISEDEAMRIFLASSTYRALDEPETGLCFEMFDAIYEMFLDEMGAL